MFIKLTRFDNRPVWLNAAFIVTVEPRKDGIGSVIVPIGDGFDYDVRESVEEILAKLDGQPPVAVVPVPAPDCLTKTPPDVSPVREPPAEAVCENEKKPAGEKRPRKRPVRKSRAGNGEKGEERKTGETASVAAKPAALELSGDQVERLLKLAPKSVGKLKNTLATQFHVADVGTTVQALGERGILALEGSRVVWSAVGEPVRAET